MGTYFDIDVKNIFGTMAERFRPEGAEGLTAVFGYDIRDEGKWRLAIKDNRMQLEAAETLDGCDVVAQTDGRTFVGLNIGKIDAMEAMTSQKLKLKGDAQLFGKLSRMFRKFVPAGASAPPEQELIVLKRTISVKQRFATGPVMGKFLTALKEKKILAIRCPECGRLQSPPREVCAVCRVRNTEWVEIGPGGEMRMLEYCYYASPDPLTGETRETPYGAAGILLDGCRDEEVFWHLLRPDQLDQVKMGIVMGDKVVHGTRLRPVWAEERTGNIFDLRYFEIEK